MQVLDIRRITPSADGRRVWIEYRLADVLEPSPDRRCSHVRFSPTHSLYRFADRLAGPDPHADIHPGTVEADDMGADTLAQRDSRRKGIVPSVGRSTFDFVEGYVLSASRSRIEKHQKSQQSR